MLGMRLDSLLTTRNININMYVCMYVDNDNIDMVYLHLIMFTTVDI